MEVDGLKFKASLHYIAKPCIKKEKENVYW
jgi:hypothetical protein